MKVKSVVYRDLFMRTRFPEFYENCLTTDKNFVFEENHAGIIPFEDTLDSNQEAFDPFFKRG